VTELGVAEVKDVPRSPQHLAFSRVHVEMLGGSGSFLRLGIICRRSDVGRERGKILKERSISPLE
jgi:hypothetical protein